MEKVVRKFSLGQEPDDIEFWLEKDPVERLRALEQIRQNHIFMFYNGVNPGFQRVYKSFKLK